MLKRLCLFVVALLLVSSRAFAGPIGTNGPDLMFFDGVLQSVSRTVVNPYGTGSVTLSGTYNVNQTTYDGLGDQDLLLGTNADDLLIQGDTPVSSMEVFLLGDGNDVLLLASMTDVLGDLIIFSGQGDDIVWGNAGNDTLFTSNGDDIVDGGPGDDKIGGEGGTNTLIGGSGTDTATYSDAFALLQITRTALNQYTIVSSLGTDYLTDIEFIESDPFTGLITRFDLSTLPFDPAPVPEPASLLLLGSGLGAVAVRMRRRRA